jgi:hypothetical protein
VKLLFDENLSRKLVLQLSDLYHESIHVSKADLLESRPKWCGSGTGRIPLGTWNEYSVGRPRISEFAADPDLAVLVLDSD